MEQKQKRLAWKSLEILEFLKNRKSWIAVYVQSKSQIYKHNTAHLNCKRHKFIFETKK